MACKIIILAIYCIGPGRRNMIWSMICKYLAGSTLCRNLLRPTLNTAQSRTSHSTRFKPHRSEELEEKQLTNLEAHSQIVVDLQESPGAQDVLPITYDFHSQEGDRGCGLD